jgi:hypothetical protein
LVIEHVFVTTLDGPTALERIRQFLGNRGFLTTLAPVATSRQWDMLPDAAAGPATPLRLQMRRGEEKAAKAESIARLPQAAAVEFDRGRVTLAVEIELSPAWGGLGLFHPEGREKKTELHRRLLYTIATGIEQVVLQDLPEQDAAVAWRDVERQIAEAAANRRRRRNITIVVILAIVAALILWAIWAANQPPTPRIRRG